MKRSALLIFGVLALASCAPSFVQRTDPDTTAGLSFIGMPPAIWFKAGLTDALDLAITIKGTDMRVNAPDYCKVNGAEILCTVPNLPAGKNFVLPMKGSNISAVAVYKRASGLSYNSTARQ